jgi:hypothetical protein
VESHDGIFRVSDCIIRVKRREKRKGRSVVVAEFNNGVREATTESVSSLMSTQQLF